MKMKNNNVLDKANGCLIGLACGDYLGMPYEFMSSVRAELYFQSHKLEPIKLNVFGREVIGFYTDDTSMMICLAESLIEKGFDPKDQFLRYKKWFREGYATPYGDRPYGIGQQTLKALMGRTVLANDPKAGGNGALMRCAPVGLRYYQHMDQLIKYSIQSAIVTHNNPIATWSCVVLNSFIAYALKNVDKQDFCQLLLSETSDIPEELQNLLKTDFNKLKANQLQTSGYSLNTLAIALYAFFTTNTFEDCLTKAIIVGGDTDTQGAVAGALAGSYYGYEKIPRLWRETLMRHEYITNLAEKLYINSQSEINI